MVVVIDGDSVLFFGHPSRSRHIVFLYKVPRIDRVLDSRGSTLFSMCLLLHLKATVKGVLQVILLLLWLLSKQWRCYDAICLNIVVAVVTTIVHL